MTYVDDIIKAVEAMTPDEGFNVCIQDAFEEDPFEALILVGHFNTREEAEKVADDYDEDVIIHIYGNNKE